MQNSEPVSIILKMVFIHDEPLLLKLSLETLFPYQPCCFANNGKANYQLIFLLSYITYNCCYNIIVRISNFNNHIIIFNLIIKNKVRTNS